MSQENVDLVESVLIATRDDASAMATTLDEHVVFTVPPGHPAGEVFHGPEGVTEFFRRWIGAFEDWSYEPEEMIDAGDSVVAAIRQWGRGKGSGAPVEQRFWQVWTLRDGKAVRVANYWERAEALAAAGLSE